MIGYGVRRVSGESDIDAGCEARGIKHMGIEGRREEDWVGIERIERKFHYSKRDEL